MKSLNEKLKDVEGYKPKTLGQKLGLGTTSPNQEAQDEQLMVQMKHHQNASDIKKLFEDKTNKEDTESQMNSLEVVHRMLVSVAVLLTEFGKMQVAHKHETEASKQQAFKTLYEQAHSVQ